MASPTNDLPHRTPRENLILWGAVLGGAALVTTSLFIHGYVGPEPAPSLTWWVWGESLLLNLGAAVLLIAPIELFSSGLRRQITKIAEHVDGLTALDERVKGLLAADVAERRTPYLNLVERPTLRQIQVAVRDATREGLIDAAGARVLVNEALSERLRFTWVLGPLKLGWLRVTLEEINGTKIKSWTTLKGISLARLLADVGKHLDRRGEVLMPESSAILTRLSETILHALDHPVARPIVEFHGPQWALTASKITATSRSYDVSHARPDRTAMDVHIKRKPWLDHNSYDAASIAAYYLYPPTDAQKQHPRHQ